MLARAQPLFVTPQAKELLARFAVVEADYASGMAQVLTMDEVVCSARRVADIMQEITAASSEQSAGIEQRNMASLLVAAASAATATAAVTVSIGQPGFYGRIDVGNYPAPALIYAQPVIVARPQYYSARPIYLRVPPGHARNWFKHCRRYNACHQEVYFVQDSWYNKQYAPRYRQEHARPPAHRPPPQHGRPGPDRHDERRDDGPGKGHGHDNGRGNGNNGHRN